MADRPIAVFASSEVIEELARELAIEDVPLSDPVATESAADALDAPISGEELQHALLMITVILKTGTAALAFTEALNRVLRRHSDQSATIGDPKTGRPINQVDSSTPAEAILPEAE